MADEAKNIVDAAADAAKANTETAGEAAKKATNTAETVVKQQAKTAETATKKATDAAKTASKTQAKAAKTATKKATRRAKPQRRKTRKPEVATDAGNERNNDVNFDPNNWFAAFNAVPAAAPFQTYFAEAGERSQDAFRRSQKAAEELADLTRSNVEALVDAGRIAAEGARSIGQDVVESGRDGIEQAADTIRSLAEAKSPTEFVQLQGELARASFDRFVSESSRFSESMVKLAGEAFQPISNRASETAERINKFVA